MSLDSDLPCSLGSNSGAHHVRGIISSLTCPVNQDTSGTTPGTSAQSDLVIRFPSESSSLIEFALSVTKPAPRSYTSSLVAVLRGEKALQAHWQFFERR
jgi:hypothetical protein